MAVAHDGWRWQGRQYHMWFGHGTKAPDEPGVKDFHDAALSLGEATTHAHLRDAADEFSRGMTQVGLGQFPRFLANAADLAGEHRDGALQRIQYRRSSGPTRMPGGGWREVTPGEMIRMDRYGMALERLRKAEPTNPLLQSLRAPNSIPSEEFVQRVEGEATAAQQRAQSPTTAPPGSLPPVSSEPFPPLFSFVGPGSEFNVFGGRNIPGVVTATGNLPHLEAPWPANGGQQGAPVPAQVAAQLVGRTFPRWRGQS